MKTIRQTATDKRQQPSFIPSDEIIPSITVTVTVTDTTYQLLVNFRRSFRAQLSENNLRMLLDAGQGIHAAKQA
ncbi:MAG: hypothetical protein MK106_12090 [Mariniblastus sp.]|nr:hypothetical protein [Mariniblastus sp.]